MAYNVHNFQTGDLINASDFNEMDNAIKAHNDILYTVKKWNLAEDGTIKYNAFCNPSSQRVGNGIVYTNSYGFSTVRVQVEPNRKYYFLSEGTARVYPNSNGYNGGVTARFICYTDSGDRFISGLGYVKPSTETDETVTPPDAKYAYISYYAVTDQQVTADNMGWYWFTDKAENDHNNNETSSLIKVINWNLFDNDDSSELLKIAIRNTDQTVGNTVVKANASNMRTIKVNVEGLSGVYFHSESSYYVGTGYNGGNASRFACYTDKDDKVIQAYSYPQPQMDNQGLPVNVSIVPSNAKWLYISDVTTDTATVKDDRSNLAVIWATTHAENDHKNIEENRIDYLADLVASGSSDISFSGVSDVQTVRKPTFIFTFDDGTDGDINTKVLFDKYGFKCGFALLSYNTNTRYKDWQKDGFEILSHSTDATAFNGLSDDEAEVKLKNSLIELKGRGYDVVGWVTPSSVITASQVERLKKYYQFGFGAVSGSSVENIHTMTGEDIRQLRRWSLESNTITDTMAKIDECIATNGLMVFYGHSYPSTDNNMTVANMKTILDYLKAKVDNEEVYVLPPRKAINNYYQFRWSELRTLFN